MARINVEEKWWNDPRRERLTEYLGSPNGTDSVALKLWRMSQDYWQKGELIPGDIFIHQFGAKAILQSGLARVYETKKIWLYPERSEIFPNVPDRDPNAGQRELNEARTRWGSVRELHDLSNYYIYACGSREHHFWLIKGYLQRVEAGKKSAKKRKQINGTAQPLQKLSNETPFRSEISSNGPNVSISSSCSISVSKKKKKEELKGDLPAVVSPPPTVTKELAKIENGQKASQFISAYATAYKTKYPGGRPEDLNDGKTRGQILNWIKEYPLDRACELIQVYFQMENKWFGQKGHDFITFANNLNIIGQALDSGIDPGGNQIDWESLKEKCGAE